MTALSQTGVILFDYPANPAGVLHIKQSPLFAWSFLIGLYVWVNPSDEGQAFLFTCDFSGFCEYSAVSKIYLYKL